MNNKTTSDGETSRRDFLKTSSTAAVASAATLSLISRGTAYGQNSDTIRVGLVGCGGRGTGAANQALSADDNVKLTAVADVFPDKVDRAVNGLKKRHEKKVDVPHQFVGLDAYQKLIDSGVDLVVLATPPGFRPLHFRAVVEAGKHCFIEKPMATDAPGVRSIMESVKISKQKNLAIVAGFCWRYDYERRAFYERILGGEIGDIQSVYATYLTGPVKPMRPDSERKPEWSDIEWQVRNWYNFAWLGGDGLVEQAVHSIDKIAWTMRDKPPVSCTAVGGRGIPNNSGNIFDHIEVNYSYPKGVRAFMAQRQQRRCHNENSDYLLGTKGRGEIARSIFIENAKGRWGYDGKKENMYQIEHNELFESIRAGKPINNGDRMALSTMMAIMGRTAAYTGKEITYEQILSAKEDRYPKDMNWKTGKHTPPPLAKPGLTPFV
jgi:predicted dehydrogenase